MLRVVPVVLLAFAIAACGDSDTGAREVPEDAGPAEAANRTTLQVRLTRAGIVPDTLRLAAGDTVRLVVVNETAGPLEFLMGRQAGPYAFEVPFFAGVEMLEMEGPLIAAETPTGSGRPARPGGEMRHAQAYFFLRPGEEGAATFVVPPDHAGVWSMACFLEGHAREGLRGVVVVE